MQTASILPELASGRGTTRRVVEGQPRQRFNRNPPENRIGILQYIDGGNPKRLNPGLT